LANAKNLFVYANNNKLIAGNNKAGVLKVSSMLKNNTAFLKSDKILINPA